MLWQAKEGVGDIVSARVIRAEGRDELCVLATNILHGVDAGHGEDGHFARGEGLPHRSGPVLHDHVGLRCPGHGDDVVAATRVEVGWEHGARAKVKHGYREAVANRSGEGGSIGIDNTARREGVLVLLGEVE